MLIFVLRHHILPDQFNQASVHTTYRAQQIAVLIKESKMYFILYTAFYLP